MSFTPITTQDELDEIVKNRVDRERRHTRKWERRAKRHLAQLKEARNELEETIDAIDELLLEADE